MSHYTEMKVKTLVKNEAELIAALETVFGKGSVDVHENGKKLTGGYDAAGANKTAHIVVKKEVLKKKGIPGCYGWNDIGYERQKDGSYMLHADPADFSKEKRDEVHRTCTENVICRVAKEKGYMIERKVLANGKIQLIADQF